MNGKTYTPEMQEVIAAYQKAIDDDILNFVNDILSERDVLPITVGFISDTMGKEIAEVTGIEVSGNRVVLRPDEVRHIIKRHGPEGKSDHSMKDIKDIARLSYVLANYDAIEWDGGTSHSYRTKEGQQAPQITIKKRVYGTYYVIEVISDSKSCKNYISTIYLKKAED